MSIYRRIYKDHYGPIPIDEDGRTYEIHHVDGNHENNDIANLKCITFLEHYNIHYSQGDWAACLKMSARMKLSPEEKSRIGKLAQQKRVKDGTHHFLGPNVNRKRVENGTHKFSGPEMNNTRVENGTHQCLGGEIQRKRVEDGTHNFIGGELQRKRVAAGTHNLLGGALHRKRVEEGTHNFLNPQDYICPHCGKEGRGFTMKRWHFDNCRVKAGQDPS